MESGYFQPLHNQFKVAWIWWVILLSFEQVLYYENNLQFNWLTAFLMVLIIAYLYFLIRQRRFFASKHHLYFTRDFRLGMVNIDLAYISHVRLKKNSLNFVYMGKDYHYFVMGRSNKLLEEVLKDNHVEFKRSTK
ncbi:EbsA family protein [Lactococcus termiticola]|uniref:Pore-forming protein n=1 Tax=Lactococcus termiticola TaxID=2169526 RepID=A0A2R5HF63_9LACT|nr:EbsA family protein [Lactococcus termiticola]GBG96709.1 hypothetical protein NtB2_00833 [Lactococcus termiticola]